MSESKLPSNTNSTDEIDLGQLFQLIGNGFKRIFRIILHVFVYLKTNAIVLSGLVILGVVLGFGLNQITTKKLKTEVIVKPNLESKNYLYNVVNEIQANIKARDTSLFESLGIDIENLQGSEIIIEEVGGKNEIDLEYLELLEKFQNSGVISDVLRSEILNKSSLNHRIVFYYNDAEKGQDFSMKIIDYINSNEYFEGLIKTYRTNAENRVRENKTLLKQVDDIIANYTKKMAQEEAVNGNDRIVLDNQERVNITGLFDLKNNLIRDIESKNVELQERTDAIKVINFGKPQQVQKAFYGKNIILIPLTFVVLFFLISFIKYLNKRSAEIED